CATRRGWLASRNPLRRSRHTPFLLFLDDRLPELFGLTFRHFECGGQPGLVPLREHPLLVRVPLPPRPHLIVRCHRTFSLSMCAHRWGFSYTHRGYVSSIATGISFPRPS